MNKGIIYKHRVKPIQCDRIMHAAHNVFNTTKQDITGSHRGGCLPYVRRICCVVLRGYGLSYDAVGELLNMTRHNVMYHCKQHVDQIKQDMDYSASFDALVEEMS